MQALNNSAAYRLTHNNFAIKYLRSHAHFTLCAVTMFADSHKPVLTTHLLC
jgi:hypothetical protein